MPTHKWTIINLLGLKEDTDENCIKGVDVENVIQSLSHTHTHKIKWNKMR